MGRLWIVVTKNVLYMCMHGVCAAQLLRNHTCPVVQPVVVVVAIPRPVPCQRTTPSMAACFVLHTLLPMLDGPGIDGVL